MGKKSKHTPRTKNNAKPSSSSRSAELLGSVPTFVGFSVHSDLGIVPLAPGFSTTEQISDVYDTTVKSEFQMIFKKMTKKDPMTKKKAVQEFITSINQSQFEEIKAILPLWPKFYENLANDSNYLVRELAQTALQLLVSKCKKAVAPYLKQLVPIWLASQFDNYAPAASIASSAFAETFTHNTDRTCEVCLHCQNEILDYVTQNIIHHTVSTLSGKNISAEEAQQKYNCLIVWSLKELSFFIQNTADSKELSQCKERLKQLLAQPKFWGYTKNKLNTIRAAMFELIYNLLTFHNELIVPHKQQLIPLVFQNIDESDSLVASHLWGCILLLQVNFNDWYVLMDFQKMLWPKFTCLVLNKFNGNAQTICPHTLPFFSQLYEIRLAIKNYVPIIKEYFNNFKNIIIGTDISSKSENMAIIKAYYECLRYIMHKLGNDIETENDHINISSNLIEENVIDVIKLCLIHKNTITVKQCFSHTSALIAYFDKQQQEQLQRGQHSSVQYFTKLLDVFWLNLYEIIKNVSINCTDNIILKERICELDELIITERLIQFAKDLYVATPTLEDRKVIFSNLSDNNKLRERIKSANSNDDDQLINNNNNSKNSLRKTTMQSNSSFVHKELKHTVINIFKICLHNIIEKKNCKFIKCLHSTIDLFNDAEFFNEITENKDLLTTLNCIYKAIILLSEHNETDESNLYYLMDIIFRILQEHPEKIERFQFIKQHLIQLPNRSAQILLLKHLLSHPWCLEMETRNILAQCETKYLIRSIVRDGLCNHSKYVYHILYKCFTPMDNHDILIHSDTVNDVLEILSNILLNPYQHNNNNNDNITLDDCISFLTTIFPTVCYTNSKYSSQEMKNKAFICILKTHLLNYCELKYITDETMIKVRNCWQMALPTNFIINDDLLKEFVALLKELLHVEDLTCNDIHGYANVLATFILHATKCITNENERLNRVDVMLKTLVNVNLNMLDNILNTILFAESLKNTIIPSSGFYKISNTIDMYEVKATYENALLNTKTIVFLLHNDSDILNKKNYEKYFNDNTEECQQQQQQQRLVRLSKISEHMQCELLNYMKLASAGDFFKDFVDKLEISFKSITDNLSTTIQDFFFNNPEASLILTERLIENYIKDCSNYAQCISHIKYMQQYAAFDDNATILLFEELQERFLCMNHIEAYVHLLQTFLPKLEAQTITIHSSIKRIKTEDIWPKAIAYRCLIENYYNAAINETLDKEIILSAVEFINSYKDILHQEKHILLYQCEVSQENITHVVNAVEYINLLITMLKCNPYALTLESWDIIRIGLGHWILSLVKSTDLALETMDQKTFYFAVHVFQLFATVTNFLTKEQQKSSTELIKRVYDEWLNVFHRNSYLSLFKQFYHLCGCSDIPKEFMFCWQLFLNALAKILCTLDHDQLYAFCKSTTTITLDHICNFLFKNLSHPLYSMRILSVYMIKQLTTYFIKDDLEIINKQHEQMEKSQQYKEVSCHFLSRFEEYLKRYETPIYQYNDEFSFKPTEICEMESINNDVAFSYLMLWDCIINICSEASISLRSVYTKYLNKNKYEQTLLHFLFRAMPEDILKNHSTKQMVNNNFKYLTWLQIRDGNFTLQQYVCHLYHEILIKLPALVRAWWNTSPSRQKNFVDTLTTNFVSPIICNEELMAIVAKKEKHDNMQINVRMSTREIVASYSIDDVQMELIIILPINYPLGAVKVECNKQIGGRASARNIVMQLTILLTHQNGTILNGLALWRNNLDKLFEGIEECYICYAVIQHDTCQLPKLTCKTCKKKFHGQCLYKWFFTSNKSTCPICRNVF